MDLPAHSELEQAWRAATDSDVQHALACPTDYAPEAFEVIQSEGRRRGVEPVFTRHSPIEDSVYLRLLLPAARFVAAHRFVSASLLAAGLRGLSWWAAQFMAGVQPLAYSGGYVVVLTTGLGLLALPLRSYSMAARVTLAGFFGQAVVSFTFLFLNWRLVAPGMADWLLFPVLLLLIGWGLPFSLVEGIVFLRRRYAPVYAVGHCSRCDYDLRGLVEPRCPECGLPFEGPAPAAQSEIPGDGTRS